MGWKDCYPINDDGIANSIIIALAGMSIRPAEPFIHDCGDRYIYREENSPGCFGDEIFYFSQPKITRNSRSEGDADHGRCCCASLVGIYGGV